ncbi:flagellar basal body rod protein FlgC [Rubrivirga sp. S365]|uniref:flagellar basal body rod protein FlgC n=1 Tax=Rubrivirga sp. S365 TaxID=3076080 RepID=UPI0028C7184A|nr:flagellar basal body rod protein FlgC [Rubrivirga sp. S365]MDT7857323.1 flagellar basal body rod protein FlgC [Rubrivirga sp. S365]
MPIGPRFFSVFRASARGLEAQRVAMGVATENIANATTSRTADGTPYRVRRAVHRARGGPAGLPFRALLQSDQPLTRSDARHLSGLTARRFSDSLDAGPQTEVEEQDWERLEYDPSHPDADADGYVHYPDVNVVTEMAGMISANRVYEANLSTLTAAKEMLKRTLEL